MKRSKLFVIIIISIINASCKKDFLEVVDNTVLLKQGYVVDLVTTSHYMNGIYTTLASKYADGLYLPYAEIVSDNMKPVGATIPVEVYTWNQSPNVTGQFMPSTSWLNYYRIIRDCNFVIERSEKYKEQNLAKSNDLKGQALAIRALMHFTLVNTFAQAYNFTSNGSHAGVPYIKNSDIETPVTRQTVSVVYSEIISDVNEALSMLSKDVTTKEIMNYQAAKALLARAYLFSEDYQKAKNVSVQVLKDVPIMGDGYPNKLYTAKETESLFQLPPGSSSSDNYYGLFMGYYSNPKYELKFVATKDIADLLSEYADDKRKNWVKESPNGWLIEKFPVGATGKFPIPEGDHYQTLLRSSELCLTAAESFAKLSIDDSARYYLNAIRNRAIPSSAPITASGSALVDSIYKERRKEMAFDGLRMFDLLRWKMGVVRMDSNSPDAKSLPYPSDRAISPIPKEDVELAGIPQNTGY